MKITDMFYEYKYGTETTTTGSSISTMDDSSFNSIMQTAETKQATTDNKTSTSSYNKTNNNDNYSSKNNTSDKKDYNSANSNASTESKSTEVNNQADKTVAEKPETEKPKTEKPQGEVDDAGNETVQAQEMAAMENIAEVMGVTVEVLQNLMNSLNLTISDLTDKANVDLLLTTAFECENQFELLDIPEIKEIMTTIDEVAQEFTEQVKQNANVTTDIANLSTNVSEKVVQDDVKTQEKTMTAETEVTSNVVDETIATTVNLTNQQIVNQVNERGTAREFDNLDDDGPDAIMQNTSNVSGGTADSIFKSALARTQTMSTLDQTEILKQITSQIKVQITGDVTEMSMKLNPKNLGDISLKVVTENGVVSAHLKADDERVKEILESNANHLKELLSEKGIEVSEINVSVNTGEADDLQEQFAEGQKKNNRRINQILNGIEAEEAEIDEVEYVTEAEVMQANVEYNA